MSTRMRAPSLGTDTSASHIVSTRYGIEFDAREDWWPINGKQGIDIGSIRALIAPTLLPGLEATLRHASTKYSWATLTQYRWALAHFQRTCFPAGTITTWQITDIRRYRQILLA